MTKERSEDFYSCGKILLQLDRRKRENYKYDENDEMKIVAP